MKTLGLAILLFVGAQAFATEGDCVHTPTSFNCVEFLHNYDGDTITTNIPSVHPLIGHQITVRVFGIDAPEMETTNACERRMAIKARDEALRFLQNGHRIDLKNVMRDKYFRVLADVQVDGQSLAQHLIDENLAVPYDGGHKNPVNWCKR